MFLGHTTLCLKHIKTISIQLERTPALWVGHPSQENYFVYKVIGDHSYLDNFFVFGYVKVALPIRPSFY